MIAEKSNVRSVHLYFSNKSLDFFIRVFLHQILRDFDEKEIIYHFIRFYEGSPHIRLIYYLPESSLNDFDYRFTDHLPEFYAKHQIKFEKWMIKINDSTSLNQILAEIDHFRPYNYQLMNHISSKILRECVVTDQWSLDRAFGHCLQLAFIFIYEVIKEPQERANFSDFGYNRWSDYLNELSASKDSSSNLSNKLRFEQSESKIYSTLNHLNTILDQFESDSASLSDWVQESRAVGKLYNQSLKNEYNAKQHHCWDFLDRIIHLNNNRFGLLYLDDYFMYYCLRQFFSQQVQNR